MDTTYLYQAYCLEYDENYIIKTHRPLPIGTTIIDEDCTSTIMGAYQPTSPPTYTPLTYHYTKPTANQYIGMYGILFTCLIVIALIIAYNNRTKS